MSSPELIPDFLPRDVGDGEQLEAILDSIAGAFFTIDNKSRLIRVNAAAARLCGISRAAMLGKPLAAVFPPATDPTFNRALQNAPLEFDTYFEPWNRWFQVKVTPQLQSHLSIWLGDVTERKRTESDLDAERKLLKGIVENLPIGVFVAGPDGGATLTNTALHDVWRGSRSLDNMEKYEQYEAWDAQSGRKIHAKDWPSSLALLTGAAQPPRPFRVRRFDGTEGYLEIAAAPLTERGGTTIATIAVVQDITERMRVEEALRASEARQRFLLHLGDRLRELKDPVAIQVEAVHALGTHLGADRVGYAEDLDGIYVTVTRNYTKDVPGIEGVYRYEDYGPGLVSELRKGKTVVRPDIANDNLLTAEEKAAHHVLQLGATMNIPLVKDGSLVAILFVHYKTAHHFTDAERTLAESVAERTWSSVVRARAEEKLKQTQSTLQSFYDSAPFQMGIAELQADQPVAVVGNRALAEFLSVPIENIAGRTSDELGAPSEYGRLWAENYRRSQREGVPVKFEYQYLHASGPRWYSATANNIGISQNGRPRFSFVVEDVTERKRAEIDRQQHASQLKRANDDLLHFAYAVGHDLQSPLRTMTLFSQLLERKFKDQLDGEGQTHIRNIVDASSRMAAMIRDLLKFAVVAGQEFVPAPVNLDDALAAALENLSSEITAASATITFESLPTVSGAHGLIVQLLQNLIGNAIRYRHPGLPLEIHITAAVSPQEATISVRDNGIGFDAKHADLIFGAFQRLNRGSSGTGMGLAICKRIVEKCSGRITATAQPGAGATFSFTLPLAK